jgi:hypothetical protein
MIRFLNLGKEGRNFFDLLNKSIELSQNMDFDQIIVRLLLVDILLIC